MGNPLSVAEQEKFVPSDLKIIEATVSGSGGYFECRMVETERGYELEMFESRGRGFQD